MREIVANRYGALWRELDPAQRAVVRRVGLACDYTTWGGLFFAAGSGDNLLGSCAGASHGPGSRAALGNWSTFISHFTP